MINKFSILKHVDTDKLDEKITQYRFENGKNKEPYLFMSKATGDALAEEVFGKLIQFIPGVDTLKARYSNAAVGEYNGYKIYENNDLEFGEVEIR